ncbi:MAG: maleylpyruvate isomerase family mycothiol-dependent enzyme [Micromonosporaceae bacterium]
MTSDQERLAGYVEIWRGATDDFVRLARGLDAADLARPTDLPGWDVHAVVAHIAHLESSLAGNPQEQVEVPEAPHVKGPLNIFTEGGTIARASRRLDELIDEIESSVAQRYAALRADPPTDAKAPADGFAALLGWSWDTLLHNRPVDVWMHEQDIRRAVGRLGGLDTPAAGHTAGVYAASLPYVVGKKVGAAPGTTVLLDVADHHPTRIATTVGDNGRAVPVDAGSAVPDVTLAMDFPTWMILAGGRRAPRDVSVEVTGDQQLGQRVLEQLAVTL